MTDRKETDERGRIAADPKTFRIATLTAVILSAAVIVASVTVAVGIYRGAAMELLSVKIVGAIGITCMALIWGIWGLIIIASDTNSLKKNRELDE